MKSLRTSLVCFLRKATVVKLLININQGFLVFKTDQDKQNGKLIHTNIYNSYQTGRNIFKKNNLNQKISFLLVIFHLKNDNDILFY